MGTAADANVALLKEKLRGGILADRYAAVINMLRCTLKVWHRGRASGTKATGQQT
jgi:hypothetical protein